MIRHKVASLMVALCALLASGAAHGSERYNEVRQKSSHNAYAKDVSLMQQLLDGSIRSLEVDIHNGRMFEPSLSGDWYVYHFDFADGRRTTCSRLSDCLATLRAFHVTAPWHEVVTLWVDLKDGLKDEGHGPDDLDALVTRWLPPGTVYTPADMMARCTGADSLSSAVRRCGWPTLDEMRGRFVVVLTGSKLAERDGRLERYVGEGRDADRRVAFIAPSVNEASDVGSVPCVIFYNLSTRFTQIAATVFRAGFIGRVWGVDDAKSWAKAVHSFVHHIATDALDTGSAPWARTDEGPGQPFEPIRAPAPSGPRRVTGALLEKVARHLPALHPIATVPRSSK